MPITRRKAQMGKQKSKSRSRSKGSSSSGSSSSSSPVGSPRNYTSSVAKIASNVIGMKYLTDSKLKSCRIFAPIKFKQIAKTSNNFTISTNPSLQSLMGMIPSVKKVSEHFESSRKYYLCRDCNDLLSLFQPNKVYLCTLSFKSSFGLQPFHTFTIDFKDPQNIMIWQSWTDGGAFVKSPKSCSQLSYKTTYQNLIGHLCNILTIKEKRRDSIVELFLKKLTKSKIKTVKSNRPDTIFSSSQVVLMCYKESQL